MTIEVAKGSDTKREEVNSYMEALRLIFSFGFCKEKDEKFDVKLSDGDGFGNFCEKLAIKKITWKKLNQDDHNNNIVEKQYIEVFSTNLDSNQFDFGDMEKIAQDILLCKNSFFPDIVDSLKIEGQVIV